QSAVAEYAPAELTARSPDGDARHRAALWRFANADGSFRAAVPPVRVVDFARAAALADWSADAAFGVVVGPAAAAGRRDALRAAARGVGGDVFFVDGGGGGRAAP